jgi:hypothetical protein
VISIRLLMFTKQLIGLLLCLQKTLCNRRIHATLTPPALHSSCYL